MAFQLIKTQIKVEGTDGDIIFFNLSINQYLADVNSFRFTWRQQEGEATLTNHVSFYQKNLSKLVTIKIQDGFTFKGIIYAINCSNQDMLGVSYEIIGKGLFVKLDQVPECNSFYKKKLTQIFNTVNNTKGTTLKLSPKNKGELFYTVQYNQTGFEFLKMMAARHGEWLYYTGEELVMDSPGKETVSLKQEEDVFDVEITAKMVKAPLNYAGFDQFKGEVIQSNKSAGVKSNGLIAAGLKAGENAFGTSQTITHAINAPTSALLKDFSALQENASLASVVVVSARSANSKVKLAGKIKLVDEKGGSAGEYIITEIHHHCSSDNHYENQFIAIPAETEVPPYTNPQLITLCKPQPALVVNNEDKDGLDRIKVHFPWQQAADTSPWISVLTPHAGKGKGIRFLPEVDEEVIVGFIDNNAERPYVLGAIHTDKNKSGNDQTGNNLKIIGSRTGRRIEIDDKEGILLLKDFDGKGKGNSLKLSNSDKETIIKISSGRDDNHFTSLQLIEGIGIGMNLHQDGGKIVTSIFLKEDGKKILITTEGDIEMKADGNISMSAANISINASQELKMEGKLKGVEMKGQKIAVEATTELKAKGLQTTVEGTVTAELKSGAMTTVKGALVAIN
ncbi:MAG: hypothetical protein JWP81_3421 [Ferruginibacter sp.]|nr:hypothetical protein [Ferruginibacter sp.]